MGDSHALTSLMLVMTVIFCVAVLRSYGIATLALLARNDSNFFFRLPENEVLTKSKLSFCEQSEAKTKFRRSQK
ncbi:MAG: hypothetical protein J6V99_06915 [Neisseriaceae bacterium]|nr:hypothetical protein [Neisseriaceae bacterium]